MKNNVNTTLNIIRLFTKTSIRKAKANKLRLLNYISAYR